jgi:hypothetical protein
MGQCKSKDQDFKSYPNAVFRRLLLFVYKSEHRDFKGNMGQCKSEGKDFKRDYAKEKLRKHGTVSLRKETLKNRKKRF